MTRKQRFMTRVWVLSAITVMLPSSGFAESHAQCLTRCGLTFISDQSKCPSAMASDMANIECVQKATDIQHACVDACPKDGATTTTPNTNTSTGTGTNSRPQTTPSR